MQTFFIGFFGLAAIVFAVAVFRTSSMMRSALALLFSQTALGALFLALQAEFLGVLQIMMMATEMSIMAIFMVMFMMDPGGLGGMDMSHQKRLSMIAGLGAVMLVSAIAAYTRWQELASLSQAAAADEQIRHLGRELLGRSMLVFETAGITILTAMIATTAVAVKVPAENASHES